MSQKLKDRIVFALGAGWICFVIYQFVSALH